MSILLHPSTKLLSSLGNTTQHALRQTASITIPHKPARVVVIFRPLLCHLELIYSLALGITFLWAVYCSMAFVISTFSHLQEYFGGKSWRFNSERKAIKGILKKRGGPSRPGTGGCVLRIEEGEGNGNRRRGRVVRFLIKGRITNGLEDVAGDIILLPASGDGEVDVVERPRSEEAILEREWF